MMYLTKEQYEDLRSRIETGQASLAISRQVSRQFFTRVGNASIVATTGRSMQARKLAIWAGVLAAPALLVVCVGAVIWYFTWFATLAVPLVGMFWTVIAGFTGDRGNGWYSGLGLILGLSLASVLEAAYGIPLALFTISLFVHRVTYRAAQVWLTELISTSFGAYDMLVEHIEIQDPVLAAESKPMRA